jgi:hypothetical protein
MLPGDLAVTYRSPELVSLIGFEGRRALWIIARMVQAVSAEV